MITAGKVKELRELTGAGMMDCKKALVETNGDMEEAIKYLREKGIAKAGKKSSRIAAEGLVKIFLSDDKKTGAVVEVNSETDFVAKNDEFISFVEKLAKLIAEEAPKDLEELNELKLGETTVKEILTNLISTIGENMNIRRFERFETDGTVISYLHGNGTIGVLVDMKDGKKEVVQEVALQIAAMRPEFLSKDEVPAERIASEKEIIIAQLKNEGKPEEIATKIAEGKLNKFFEEICLLNQKSIKDSHMTVEQLLKENNTEITRYVRIEKGEGLEKREENFAEEVAKQIKQ